MASFSWPRPPKVDGLSTDEAASALQKYVSDVQIHMGGLQLNSTEYGVIIGFMLSALSDATRIFDVVHRDSATSPDMRLEIEKFGLAMQSLTGYMEAATATSGIQLPISEGTSIHFDDIGKAENSDDSEAADSYDSPTRASPAISRYQHEQERIEPEEERMARMVRINVGTGSVNPAFLSMNNEQLRLLLLQDLQDHGVRIPLLSCSTSQDQQNIFVFTGTKYNAAILRNPRLWKPTLFGERASVVPTQAAEEDTRMTIPSLLQNASKTRKAEEKASKKARLVWIEIPDREYAVAHLLSLNHHQLRSRMESDLQAQNIEAQIASCRKSRAFKHIRIWTVTPKQADILSKQWMPTRFGEGAYVRWSRKQDYVGLRMIAKMMPNSEVATESTADMDVPSAIQPAVSRARREVFVKILDKEYAEDELVGAPLAKLKALARNDIENQGIPVRIASCQIIDSGSFARLRTKQPEEAQYLKAPGTWKPIAFGKGAYVVTD
ncbi:MAG: hypothetical protein Q9226_001275 [Calogaya cf. arnoldii]